MLLNRRETVTCIPLPKWLRLQASLHEEVAEDVDARIDSLTRQGYSDAVIEGARRLAWMRRRCAALCRELADEAEMTGARSPEDLDNARARWLEDEAELRLVPGQDPDPRDVPADYASQDQACPRDRVAPGPAPRRPAHADDPIDCPF